MLGMFSHISMLDFNAFVWNMKYAHMWCECDHERGKNIFRRRGDNNTYDMKAEGGYRRGQRASRRGARRWVGESGREGSTKRCVKCHNVAHYLCANFFF